MQYSKMVLRHLFTFFFFIFGVVLSNVCWSAESLPPEMEGVGVQEHLGVAVSKDLSFVDETGQTVSLQNYLDDKRPVILTLVYYSCPNLCNFLLNGLTDTLRQIPWEIGQQFQIVTISIDPTENSVLAAKKKQTYLKSYGRQNPAIENGWHFLTGSAENIQKIAQEVGFEYRYDTEQKQYAHSAVMVVLSPKGQVSRYLYGITFDPFDLKMSLLEASQGKVGSITERFLLYCYHYDPKGKKYALMAVRILRYGAGLTIIALIAFVYFLSRKKDPMHGSASD